MDVRRTGYGSCDPRAEEREEIEATVVRDIIETQTVTMK